MALYRALPGMAALLAAALLHGCKSIEVPKVPGITPYRMVIQQGNFISQEMVAQLKPGMSKEQVRYILGTPLVTDIFHADRWDYVFYRELPNGKREQRNLSVVFEDSKLARVLGDLMPADAAAPTAAGFPAVATPKPNPEAAAAPEAKPAAKAAAAEPAPAAEPPASGKNWRAASDEPEKPAEAAAAPQPEPKKAEEKPSDEAPKERGFFGRMLEKIGL